MARVSPGDRPAPRRDRLAGCECDSHRRRSREYRGTRVGTVWDGREDETGLGRDTHLKSWPLVTYG